MNKFIDENNKSWENITPTIHNILANSWELIEYNDRVGLGALDVSGLEVCNKIMGNIRTNLSRKIAQRENLIDTIRRIRMWISSDPLVELERKKTKTICKHCKSSGHSIYSCMFL